MLPSGRGELGSPSDQEFSDALVRATEVMKALRERGSITGGMITGALFEIPEVDGLVVISDLHGDFECLAGILDEIHYEDFLAEPRNKIIFMGDYVDRGSNSIGVLYSLCRLKIEHPESTVLMRGNHEAPSEFPFASHDYPFEISDRFGEEKGRAIYRKSLMLFRELAVAAILSRRLLIVHGGLPALDGPAEDYRSKLAKAQENHLVDSILEEVLWNDPRQIDKGPGWEPSPRGVGRLFGSIITERWLDLTGTVCIVRGHEPCKGYRLDHGGKVLTLFSSREPYPSFEPAYLKLDGEDLRAVRDATDLVQFVRYPK